MNMNVNKFNYMDKTGTYFIYGIRLDAKYIKNIINSDEIDDIDRYVLNNIDRTKFPEIMIIPITGEYESDDNFNGDAYLIGIKVWQFTFHYNGCTKVPDIKHVENKFYRYFEEFLNVNTNFLGFPYVGLYVYSNENK